MSAALFIVLEGGEGSGKSTQAERLLQRITATGRDALLTHEPGDTRLGEEIRLLLLQHDWHVDPRAELLLVLADRAQHVAEVIEPALAAGRVVVSDRFVPSSLTYQGVGRGLGVELADRLSAFAAAGLEPDLTVVLDIDDDIATTRVAAASDRMEREAPAFHAAVRAAYRSLAQHHGWRIVDASGTRDEVADRVWLEVERVLSPGAPLL